MNRPAPAESGERFDEGLNPEPEITFGFHLEANHNGSYDQLNTLEVFPFVSGASIYNERKHFSKISLHRVPLEKDDKINVPL